MTLVSTGYTDLLLTEDTILMVERRRKVTDKKVAMKTHGLSFTQCDSCLLTFPSPPCPHIYTQILVKRFWV